MGDYRCEKKGEEGDPFGKVDVLGLEQKGEDVGECKVGHFDPSAFALQHCGLMLEVSYIRESPSALNPLNLWSLIDQLEGHLHHTEQPARHTECTAPGLFLSCMVLYLGGYAIG